MHSAGLKLGLMGGTFNPIHFGHLRAAEEAAGRLGLDRVLFIPSARPPHKSPTPIIGFTHRFEMTRLATADRSGFFASDLEGRRGGPSYTIETLETLREIHGSEAELYFMAGLDAVLEIHTWKEYLRLFELTRFAVVQRPGASPERLGGYLTEHVSRDYRWEEETQTFTAPGLQPIHMLDTTRLDISSTDIRDRLSRGESIRYLTPESVRRYIIDNNLYVKD